MSVSPQVENGYVRIASELLEALMRYKCGGVQKDIIMCVIRFTYGYQRKVHELGGGFIANAINRDSRLVAKEINRLIKKNILIEVEPFSIPGRKPRKLMLNKDYTKWVNSDLQGSDPQDTVTYRTLNSALQVHSNSDPQVHKDIIIKDKLKTSGKASRTEKAGYTQNQLEREKKSIRVYEYYAENIRAGARADAIKNIAKLLKDGETDTSLIQYIANYKQDGMPTDKKYRIQANNFFGRAARYQEYTEVENRNSVQNTKIEYYR